MHTCTCLCTWANRLWKKFNGEWERGKKNPCYDIVRPVTGQQRALNITSTVVVLQLFWTSQQYEQQSFSLANWHLSSQSQGTFFIVMIKKLMQITWWTCLVWQSMFVGNNKSQFGTCIETKERERDGCKRERDRLAIEKERKKKITWLFRQFHLEDGLPVCWVVLN